MRPTVPSLPSRLSRLSLFPLIAWILAGTLFLGDPALAAGRKKTSQPKKPRSSKAKSEAQAPSGQEYFEEAWREFEVGSAKERANVIAALKKRLKKDPGDSLTQYYLGLMQAQDGPLTQAEQNLQAAAQAYPDSTNILFPLAEVLEQRGKLEEAFALYEKVAALDPRNGEAIGKLGQKALGDGDLDKALGLLTQSKALAPDNRENLRSLGVVLVKKDHFADAVPLFQTVLGLDPKDGEAWWWLAKAHEGLGKSAEAAKAYEQAKINGRKDPDLKNLVGYDLARSLNETGKVEEAIAEYQKAIKTAPDPAVGWFELGRIYQDRGDNEQAVKALQKAYDLDTKLSEAAFQIGSIHRQEEKFEEAIHALELIHKRKDEWGERAQISVEEIKEEVRQNLKDQLMELAATGNEEVMEDAYMKMLGMDVQTKKTLYHPGLRLTIMTFQKIVGMDPNDQDALEGLRDLSRTRGDLAKVKFYIKKLEKAGHITKAEADAQINDLEYKSDAGEDLAAWENRLEAFKRAGEWDKALAENQKLKAYNQGQLEYWKKFGGDKETKAAMIKATKARLQTNSETAKDLKAEKKKYK